MKKQQPHKKRFVLGVTGTFGSGKTTVARLFGSFGAKVIDADKIAHGIIQPGNKIPKSLIKAFGKSIVKKNKHIDRIALAKMVFGNKNLLKRLNKIMHPRIIRVIRKEIKTSGDRLIILDAPLLIEAGLRGLVDKLVVVKIERKVHIGRILKKRRLSKSEILKRIRAQISLQDKVRLADFIIDNSGAIEQTKKQARKIRRQLWKN